ncbi:MAG: hypothetical protein ISR95_02850 [Candidatus Marinimicrobia bacterium]|nr:hypothetical protein [Candidatus Neomarinimicrobiota bacterium]
MSIAKMGDNLFEKTILKELSTHLHRLPKNYFDEKYNPPLEEKPDDIVRIEYHCCGCGSDFMQNIPSEHGDATMTEVYLHFEKCGKGVDWRPIKRCQIGQ